MNTGPPAGAAVCLPAPQIAGGFRTPAGSLSWSDHPACG